MAQIGQLEVVFTADGAQFTKSVQAVMDKAAAFGDSMKAIGAGMTKWVTLPLVAAGSAALYLASQEEAASARMASALKNVGADVNRSVDALNAQFTALQRVTTFADDDYVNAFTDVTNITGDAHKALASMTVIADLAAAKGISLSEAATLVGKAMNGQTQALKRQGVTLKENATATEVLRALTERFGGAAAKMAQTVSGQFLILKNTSSDVAETFGKALFPIALKVIGALQYLVDVGQKVANWFAGLSVGARTGVTGLVAFVAAIGPVLVAVGSVIGVLASFAAALKFLGGTGAVISMLKLLMGSAYALLAPIAILALKFIALAAIFAFFYANGNKIAAGLSGVFMVFAATVAKSAQSILNSLAKLSERIPVVGKGIAASLRRAASSMGVASGAATLAAKSFADEYAKSGGYIENTTNLLSGAFGKMMSAVGLGSTAAVAGLGKTGAGLGALGVKIAENKLAWDTWSQGLIVTTQQLATGIYGAFAQMGQGVMDVLTTGSNDWKGVLLSFLKASLAATTAWAIAKMTIFENMSKALSAAISGPWGWLIIGGLIAATIAVGASSIPAMAEGGITNGPTMAMVGDNPSGREAVIPLDSPRAMSMLGGGGAGNQTIIVQLDGREITRAVVRGMPSELRVHGLMRS